MDSLSWRAYVCALCATTDLLGRPVQLTERPTSVELDETEAQVFEELSLVVVIDVGSDNVATAIQV